MACNCQFQPGIDFDCIKEGLAEIKAGNKKSGLSKLLWAAGEGVQLLPDDKKLVGAGEDDTLDLTAIAELEAALPADGTVAGLPSGLLLKLLLPVLQQVIIKFIEGMDHT